MGINKIEMIDFYEMVDTCNEVSPMPFHRDFIIDTLEIIVSDLKCGEFDPNSMEKRLISFLTHYQMVKSFYDQGKKVKKIDL